MKKKVICGSGLLAGFSLKVSASAGYANDGLTSMLLVGCFLLLVAGIIEGIGYLGKNRKVLLHRFIECIRKKHVHL
ncbi:MAG: hypothetical protein IPH20_19270 [Bacteroidales bacterium]|nr:hypothetical protein [Bacteroidales bacterium]